MAERKVLDFPSGYTPEVARMTPFNLVGKVALITGGSRGIGRAIAEMYSYHGAKVVINSTAGSEDLARGVLERMDSFYTDDDRRSAWWPGDISKPDVCEGAIKFTIDTMGRLDILVHNAGITRDNLLAMMSPEQWEQVMGTDLDPLYYATKPAIRRMMRQPEGGLVLAITSVSARVANPGQFNYIVAKAGMEAGVRQIAAEYAKRGIRGVYLACGPVDTDILSTLKPEQVEAAQEGMPVLGGKRLISPQEVAYAALYLASEPAKAVTGTGLDFFGGVNLPK